MASEVRKPIIPVEIRATTVPPELVYQLAGAQILRVWNEPHRGLDLVRAALKAAGAERGAARIVEANPGGRSPGEANVDLAEIGKLGFLSKIAFWRRN